MLTSGLALKLFYALLMLAVSAVSLSRRTYHVDDTVECDAMCVLKYLNMQLNQKMEITERI